MAMGKVSHEVRDGLFGFIEFNNLEKALIDSAPVQRLRCIHQLAMCFEVYPGATHTRFEHSLGVMEVASRIFRNVFERRLSDAVHQRVEEELASDRKAYWARVLRLAALLHDVGHLPFSHGAEEELLPDGWNHERLSAEIIRHSEIGELLKNARPIIDPEDVVDLCWDVRKRSKVEPDIALSPWKTLLNEIITGNTFGADRIDYLLRDSWHAGVGYGRFDPDRLIAGLRALVDPNLDEVTLGLDHGAIHAAEALLTARYFMYTQVYFHDVRRAYDMHLRDYLKNWLRDGRFSCKWSELLKFSDHEVMAALRASTLDPSDRLHPFSRALMQRQHFRTVYEQVSSHKQKRPMILEELAEFARRRFGADVVRTDSYGPKSETNDFWVATDDGSIESSLEVSGIIARLPALEFGFLFVSPELKDTARSLIEVEVQRLLRS
jgi:HD superfamily phosphohydrolase